MLVMLFEFVKTNGIEMANPFKGLGALKEAEIQAEKQEQDRINKELEERYEGFEDYYNEREFR